jgi:4-hydroxy-tetrahydrodipicolinate synthase
MRTVYMEVDRPPRISGAITTLVTPFDNGALDRVSLMALVEWQIRSGVDGLVACGLTGEGPVLTEAERAEIIATCVEISEGKVPVIAATGTNDTATTIEETRQAKALGATAALVTLPYYSKPGQKSVIQHFEMLSAAVDIPIIVHNLPSHTAIDLASTTVARLGAIPGIIGIADGTGNIERVTEWRHLLPSGSALFSTHDATSLAFTLAGGQGVISSAANVAPRLVSAMQHAAGAGNLPAASVLLDRLHPLFRALNRESEPATIKRALAILEKSKPEVRLPLVCVESDTEIAINDALEVLQAGCKGSCDLHAVPRHVVGHSLSL